MTKSMTMSSRTLALPNAEKPRGGPSLHKGNAQQRLCPLKRPKHAKKPHSFLQAILRLRQRAEQRLRSPFTPWSLGGYLTNPPCKHPSDASQSSSTSPRRGIFHSLDLGFLQHVTNTRTMPRHDMATTEQHWQSIEGRDGVLEAGSHCRHLQRV